MHTTTPVAYEFTDGRKRKLEPQNMQTAPPVKLAHGTDYQTMTNEVPATSLRTAGISTQTDPPKNAWGPIFQNREHFAELHIC